MAGILKFFDKNKTFTPKKKHLSSRPAQLELHRHAKATLNSGNLYQAVLLPPGVDLDEWLAANTVDFFNQISLLYGGVTEFCTPKSCPVMQASPKYEYHWASETIKKPIRMSAPDYIDHLMKWVEQKFDDPNIFPPSVDDPFPPDFMVQIKDIYRRLFRVYAHIYHHHHDVIRSLGEAAHLNTCFKHFYLFTREFDLIVKPQLAPLQEIIDCFNQINDLRVKYNEDASRLIQYQSCKLVVIGKASVGKTTLIRCLRDGDLGYDPKILSTDGIETSRFQLQGTTFNVFDFGGQSIYRITHQLFLTNHTLYLLVFRLTDPSAVSISELSFWMDSISSRTQSSNIILVGTHADRISATAEREAISSTIFEHLSSRYPHHIKLKPLLLSAWKHKNSSSFAQLRSALVGEAAKISLRGPACLDIVQDILEKIVSSIKSTLAPPIMDSDQIHAAIIQSASEMHPPHLQLQANQSLRQTCLLVLAQLGLISIFRSDLAQPSNMLVILECQWIASLLATIITTKSNWIRKTDRGIVSRQTIVQHIWSNSSRYPPAFHDKLLSLLQQLFILYPLQSSSHYYFIPSLLPETEPSLTFVFPSPACFSIRRFFRSQNQVSFPIALLPSVIVQLMRFGKILVSWQQGCVLQIPEQIDIQSRQSNPPRLLIRKRNAFEIELAAVGESLGQLARALRFVCSIVTTLLSEYYGISFITLYPCSEDAGCFFPSEDIYLAIEGMQSRVVCKPSALHSVRTCAVAPDLFLSDLPKNLLFKSEQIHVIKQLGQGSFGRVMLATIPIPLNTQNPLPSSSSCLCEVAVKYLDLGASSEDQQLSNRASIVSSVQTSILKQFQDEVLLLNGLSHPNIVGLVGISHGLNDSGAFSPAILLEYVSGGDLYRGIHDPFDLSKAIQIAERVLLTISKCYSAQVLFQTSPTTYPAPDPLPAFEEIDGVAQISLLYEKTLASTSPCRHPPILEIKSELLDALRRYYVGPLSNHLHQSVQTTFDLLLARSLSLRDLMMPLSWEIRLKVSVDICAGMAYLHSLSPSILHRDLKSPNVLLTQGLPTITSVDWSQPLAKVADFGLSLRLFGGSELRLSENHVSMANMTPTWCAPEFLAHEAYSGSSDVYSFGIILYELLTQLHPFSDVIAHAVKGAVIQGVRPTIPEAHLSSCPLFTELIRLCWHSDPSIRPTFPKVYQLLREIVSSHLNIEIPQLYLEEVTHNDSLKTSPLCNTSNGCSLTEVTRIEALHLSTAFSVPDGSLTWRQRRPTVSSSAEDDPSQSLFKTEHKVSFLLMIDPDSFAVGYDDGVVAIAQLSPDTPSFEIVECRPELSHPQSVSALCLNSQSQLWSGSLDGSLSVWIGNSVDMNYGMEHCYMRGWVHALIHGGTLKLSSRVKRCWAVLENGILRWYDDSEAGPDIESFSVCSSGIHAEFDTERKNILLQNDISRMQFNLRNLADSFPQWCSAISFLIQLYTLGKANFRLAHYVNPTLSSSSPAANISIVSGKDVAMSQIISLESIDQTVWSVGSNFTITEWELSSVGDEHGLHRTHRIQPLRSISVNMSGFEPRLQSLQGMLRVTPSVIWMIGANCIAAIDTTVRLQSEAQTSPIVDWQASDLRKHDDYIRSRTLVRNHGLTSANAELNLEVWTCDNAGLICIWQPQWQFDDNTASSSTNQPLLLAQIDNTHLYGATILCLAQVNLTQVWGGTSDGSIIGWDIATRTRLSSDPLPKSSLLRHQRPVIQIFPMHNPAQSATLNSKVISASRDQLILFHLNNPLINE